nr:hypothetical protein [Candidatus Sigynarchaeum springense]
MATCLLSDEKAREERPVTALPSLLVGNKGRDRLPRNIKSPNFPQSE